MTWVNDASKAGRRYADMMKASAPAASAGDSARDWMNDAVLCLEREAARSAGAFATE